MKRLITRDNVEARFRLHPSPAARVTGRLQTNEWIEAYDNAETTRSPSSVPYYSTPAGWIHAAAVTVLDDEPTPARITAHHNWNADKHTEPPVALRAEETESPRKETPPTTYPKYVMVNGGWGEPCKLLRHHAHPDHAGEYVNHATGEYTRIRQLLEDLNNE